MGAKVQGSLPQIVLLVGFDSTTEVLRVLALDTPQAEEFFGYKAFYAIVPNIHNRRVWWVEPGDEENMFSFISEHPSFSPNKYKKWIESPQFVSHVRRDINHMIHYRLSRIGRPGFDQRWHEAVRMVVLTGWVSSNSKYVKRVFDDYFENAKYWWWNSNDQKPMPIWREADVTSIEQDRKPSAAMALDWPASQLPGIHGGMYRYLVGHGLTMAQLVLKSREHFAEDGFSEVDIDLLVSSLGHYGLQLGMTEAQVSAIKLGITEPRAIEELGRMGRRKPPDEGSALAKIS